LEPIIEQVLELAEALPEESAHYLRSRLQSRESSAAGQ
jgi:hypothetical protein